MPALLYRIDDDDHLTPTLLSTKRGTRSPVHPLSPYAPSLHMPCCTHIHPPYPRPSTHTALPPTSTHLAYLPLSCSLQPATRNPIHSDHAHHHIRIHTSRKGTHITQPHKHKAQMTKPPESTPPKGQAFPFASKKLRGCRWLGVQRKEQSKLSNVSEA